MKKVKYVVQELIAWTSEWHEPAGAVDTLTQARDLARFYRRFTKERVRIIKITKEVVK